MGHKPETLTETVPGMSLGREEEVDVVSAAVDNSEVARADEGDEDGQRNILEHIQNDDDVPCDNPREDVTDARQAKVGQSEIGPKSILTADVAALACWLVFLGVLYVICRDSTNI
ncbi:hypothetical protein LTR17_006200 [Elasticomyces elasticus]|nr:hypothetical protein LTR17_006200 [Elasticomyces elasticus]